MVGWLLCVPIAGAQNYRVVDTGQSDCYNASGDPIACPRPGGPFYGQDAQFKGPGFDYTDNGNGTVTDNVTGLMWQQDPGRKMTYGQALAGARACRLAGYADWRLPTIKELYSLIDFRGRDPNIRRGRETGGLRPFLDTNFFRFRYGNEGEGERLIDSQYASGTLYVGPGRPGEGGKLFGVNFADGRIKGYGLHPRGRDKTFYVLYVRGNPAYGRNHFVDNGDGTVTDTATGLMWQQADSGRGMDWAAALSYARSLRLGGRSDWRLPSAKELQSIVDYTRSPDKTGSAAIDPVFRASTIRNEAGQTDFPCYWTGTTHASWNGRGAAAVYVAFGRAMGFMNGRWVDVHGAGAQRSDPKEGDASDFPRGRGPQGDAIRILNDVRCVRGGSAEP
jgi:hypothetical protein